MRYEDDVDEDENEDEQEEEEDEEDQYEDVDKEREMRSKSESRSVMSQSLNTLASEKSKTNAVSVLLRGLITCALSECMDELSILRSINIQNDPGPDFSQFTYYQSMEDRYMGQEDHAQIRIGCANSNFDKLAKDIALFYGIIRDACKEFNKFGTLDKISTCVHILKRMKQEEDQLLQDEENQEKIIDDIKTHCEEERLNNTKTIEDTNSNIQKLRFESEDIYLYGQREVAFFVQWEAARREQNQMKCQEKEDTHSSFIKNTKERMETENRCHAEFVRYLEESKNDCLDGIQFWMKQYDEDFDKLDGDIIKLSTNLDKIKDDRRFLEDKYNARQAEIDDFLEYKRIQEEKDRQVQKEYDAGLKIQAWWRGVMVRKRLGPYRKKKRGKGKGKDKDKKSKKK
ncbi:dynein regulatory complex protein 9-like [Sitophilus oryzae]|uniref:Dynein regulatory complex protein 9 n=1 Tax=Sitophilus oryzae TaxID=7048 RepID=A0A6J2YCV4_SITOR|nr:dynein regulatory complex protein 9-like [Sitophilus oryzae]